MRPLAPALGIALALGVALCFAPRAAGQGIPGRADPASRALRLVDGERARQVRFEGKAWTAGKLCLEGRGRGNALLGAVEIGSGDFTVRAWLRIRGLARSGAAVRFGENRFGFAPVTGGASCFVKGPLFDPGHRLASEVPGTAGLVPEDHTFTFEARRIGREVVFKLDGREVHRVRTGVGALGVPGLEPRRATMRVYRFEVAGNLMDRAGVDERAAERADRDRLQARIDEAIDRGASCLLERQQRDGSWAEHESAYPSGQTALTVFTLLKAGVPPGHPGVRRGVASILAVRPITTYVAACHLMALGETGDKRHHRRMNEILKDLLSWQTRAGAWGYPRHPSQRPGLGADGRRGGGGRGGRRGNGAVDDRADLSNTQYAALGLRAARMAGLEVPAAVWVKLAGAVLEFRGDEERLAVATAPGESRTYRMPARGFRYALRQPTTTGSMTAAGVSILAICREGLGKRMGRVFDRRTQHGIDRGLNWLGGRFSVRDNPGGAGWLHYYLYGLERVGSILGVEQIGGHSWYREGARFLVGHQDEFGAWPGQGVEASTCFAILFLRRASQATVRRAKAKTDRFAGDGPGYAVGLRGFGRWPLRVWVSGFLDEVVERHGSEVDGTKRLRVARVEYLADGEVIASVRGKPRRPWSDESYPATHHFTRPGHRQISARVFLVAPEVPMGKSQPTVVVKAPGFSVRVDDVFEPWMQLLAEAGGRNRLAGRGVKAHASSSQSSRFAAAGAADGRESTRWVCRRDDASPTLTLAWAKAVSADRIWLGPAGGRRIDAGAFDRILEVEVRINQRPRPIRIEVAADSNSVRPIEVKLPTATAIRRISITITRREPAGRRPGRAGFSEIYLTRG